MDVLLIGPGESSLLLSSDSKYFVAGRGLAVSRWQAVMSMSRLDDDDEHDGKRLWREVVARDAERCVTEIRAILPRICFLSFLDCDGPRNSKKTSISPPRRRCDSAFLTLL